MPTTLHKNRPSAGIGVVEVQKPWFFPISNMPARPSAGIGVVEVQKPMFFCDFHHARATLCGDRRGRGAKTHGFFCDFCGARATLCRDRRGRGAKTRGFLRFLRCSRNLLRGSAWSRCKNSRLFAFSTVLAQPSAGIGVVEVQKLEVFATFVVRTGPRELSRAPAPGTAARGCGRASQDATCILKQLAQSNLRRASCTEQLAQTNLHRPVCAERLA